jgi:hypothetical protein
VTVNDLCLSTGMTSTGSPRATVTKLNASTGLFVTRSCGTSGAQNEPLVLGEHVQLREPNGPLSFIPAHF